MEIICKISLIEDLYFIAGKNIVDIAKDLDVSKQYVSKVLKTQFEDKFLVEKEKRKLQNRERRNKEKSQKIVESRRSSLADIYNITAEDLRRDQASAARCMSQGSILSTKSAVYANLNAYDVKKNKLVFNENVGNRPVDLPKSYPLTIKFV